MLSTSVGSIFYAAKGSAGFFEISSVWITVQSPDMSFFVSPVERGNEENRYIVIVTAYIYPDPHFLGGSVVYIL